MAIIVLIHGASHGGWCWEKVAPILKAAGHTVHAPDLPGGGADRTLLGDITLQTYRDRVLPLIDAATQKVILVGHSMGGITITEAAEARPGKLHCLVFLTALMPKNGVYAREITAREPGSLVLRSLEMAQDGITYTYKRSNIATLFYNDCTPEDTYRAMERLRPMPRIISTTPVHTTAERYGSVPRVYIECTKDNAITLAIQRYIQRELPPRTTLTMHTGHSPFLSAPEELAGHLLDIAAMKF